MSRKSFRCEMFGHKMPEHGWWGDGLYGRVVPAGWDSGGSRSHFRVLQECPRCGQEWTTARFHGSQVTDLLNRSERKRK